MHLKNTYKNFIWTKKRELVWLVKEPPVLPRWKRNKEGLHAMLTMSFGYAIEVSPLHTLMLYNAVANGGKMMKPYLVNSIKNNGITIKEFEPTVLDEQICKAEHVIKAAQQCMEAVVTEGPVKTCLRICRSLLPAKLVRHTLPMATLDMMMVFTRHRLQVIFRPINRNTLALL